jgi:transposase
MLVEADLPDDPAQLCAMLIASDTRIAERDQRIADLEGADADARQEIERLNVIIDALQRHWFGARSEQFDPDQLDLAFEEISAALSRVLAGLDARKPDAPKARNTNRGRLSAHLERVEQIVDIDSKACTCCGGALHVIGEDVAERLDVVPTTFRVLVTRRPR